MEKSKKYSFTRVIYSVILVEYFFTEFFFPLLLFEGSLFAFYWPTSEAGKALIEGVVRRVSCPLITALGTIYIGGFPSCLFSLLLHDIPMLVFFL